MRVLLLSQWFDPEPTVKGLNFARGLVEQGFEVDVVTGFPNYPGGEVYPGYRIRLYQIEREHRLRVIRLPLYPSHNRSKIGRVFNYSSFMLAAMLFLLCSRRKHDVAYVYHPPLTVGMIAFMLRTLRGVPYVYDVQDLWPHTLKATGMVSNASILTAVEWVVRKVYARASVITVLSHGFKREIAKSGVPEGKILVIHNWADEERLGKTPGLPQDDDLQGHYFNLLFAGTMGAAQNTEIIIEAVAIATSNCRRLRLVLMGGGIEREMLQRKSIAMGLANVVFLPALEMDRIGPIHRWADALILHLRDDPLFKITIPSKLQTYLYFGRPIIIAVNGDAADIVREAQCGIVCHPGSAQEIAEAIERLYALGAEQLACMGARARRHYERVFSSKQGIAQFCEALVKARVQV
ncbi:MAG: glycosyltransferase family 4 protein [Lautropia sp.]